MDYLTLKKEFQAELEKSLEFLKKELSQIRTGRASTALVENIQVEAYGISMPIVQAGQIIVENATTIKIEPWDKSILKAIENAIIASNLGVTPINSGEVIRIVLPNLTSERKADLEKITKKYTEDVRASMRNSRGNALKNIKQVAISEDQEKSYKEELEKIFKDFDRKVSELSDKKLLEING